MRLRLLFALISLVLISACKKDKTLEKPVLLVNPTQIYLSAQVGNLMAFKIEGNSENPLSKIKITLKTANTTTVTLVDSAIGGKDLSWLYEFRVKPEHSGEELYFHFELTDAEGMSSTTGRKVAVEAYSFALTETAGHIMYSYISTPYCAYDLEGGIARSWMEHWSLKDFEERIDTTISSPSRNWRSPNGSRYVVYNTFDYSGATNVSAKEAYESGTELFDLYNIQTGDIIIVKTAYTDCCPYIVVKITDIVDNPGKTNDYYVFNIKK